MQVNINGIETRYVLSNEGGGPWLTFIHQLGGDLSIWDPPSENRPLWDQRARTARSDGMAALLPSTIARWLTPDFQAAHPEAVEPIIETFARTPPEGFAMACEALRDFDLRGRHGAIRCPTLTVAGRHDTGTPPAATQAIAEAIEGARFEMLEAAHLAPIEQSHRFAALLESFLERRV
ncbi:alpha/beta hydrolase [Paraburkholderia sp. MMS20-SJTN17]|uniref:Alpha/beta hydrolase n=1 Tax=Paraburkholderia translucens TaxID=2886945 RepID=A0ABS8KHW0_9BURK|nr:alpha/beta hydrolase [Paraburkholderia sp. MMS20-SJTN17]MCC8404323.1 alpha/beta hydrolase [Paraburkholderia sp. MMS20-SJTN17]